MTGSTGDDLTAPAERRRIVKRYLEHRVERGDRYFKSKSIATDLGLSPQETGKVIVQLRDENNDLIIERWSSGSPLTWFIEFE